MNVLDWVYYVLLKCESLVHVYIFVQQLSTKNNIVLLFLLTWPKLSILSITVFLLANLRPWVSQTHAFLGFLIISLTDFSVLSLRACCLSLWLYLWGCPKARFLARCYSLFILMMLLVLRATLLFISTQTTPFCTLQAQHWKSFRKSSKEF